MNFEKKKSPWRRNTEVKKFICSLGFLAYVVSNILNCVEATSEDILFYRCPVYTGTRITDKSLYQHLYHDATIQYSAQWGNIVFLM